VALCEKTKIHPPSKVTMKIQWIPYTYADHETGHAGDKKHKHHKYATDASAKIVCRVIDENVCLKRVAGLFHACA